MQEEAQECVKWRVSTWETASVGEEPGNEKERGRAPKRSSAGK